MMMEKKLDNSKKIRQSNIELCRIISMCLIIAHHCVFHGGAVNMQLCRNKWIAMFIFPGGKMCFDTFIAISCWFLVNQNFKTIRFLKMWCEVLFFSLLTMFVEYGYGTHFTRKEWIGGMMPITGFVQGYAATYLAFYLLLPVLSIVRDRINKKQNAYIIVVLTIFTFLSRFMMLFGTEQSAYSRVTLFVYIYFIMLYIRKYPIKLFSNPILMLLIFVLCWLGVFGFYYIAITNPTSIWLTYLTILVLDEGGMLFFIGGLALFFLFNSIKIKPSRIVNLLGGTTLAVILIHDGHFFRMRVWTLFKTSEWWYSDRFVLYILLCVIIIYLVCSVIDILRKCILERPLFNCKRVKTLCEKVDNIIGVGEEVK